MQEVHKCAECGREFPTKQALEEHVNREHIGDKLEQAAGESLNRCPACTREFPSGDSLAEHHESQHANEPASAV